MFEKIGHHVIYFDQTYYIAYAGGKRELPAKEQKEYNKLINLPFEIQRKELKRLGFDNNPNVIPVKGKALLEIIKDMNFIPFFDTFFERSHLLQVNDIIVYESIKQKNYDIALRNPVRS